MKSCGKVEAIVAGLHAHTMFQKILSELKALKKYSWNDWSKAIQYFQILFHVPLFHYSLCLSCFVPLSLVVLPFLIP